MGDVGEVLQHPERRAERANRPTAPEADGVLAAADVLVVPDILANTGGVVASYSEWVEANHACWRTADEVEARLATRVDLAWRDVTAQAKEPDASLRDAAPALAVDRVTQAHPRASLHP